ncbi:MAG: acyltransferase [Actinobacteria bacterium]|nr:acyltransferase [Actinomycetota bacterium]
MSIGSHTYIGHRCHLHSVNPVRIGDRCVIADNVFVASTDHGRVDRHAVVGTGEIAIGNDVFLGQNVVVLGGVSIGDGATVAAGAVVTRDVAAGTTVGGVPARPLRRSDAHAGR